MRIEESNGFKRAISSILAGPSPPPPPLLSPVKFRPAKHEGRRPPNVISRPTDGLVCFNFLLFSFFLLSCTLSALSPFRRFSSDIFVESVGRRERLRASALSRFPSAELSLRRRFSVFFALGGDRINVMSTLCRAFDISTFASQQI